MAFNGSYACSQNNAQNESNHSLLSDNPTGITYTRGELEALRIRGRGIYILSDEIYERIVHLPNKQHFSTACIESIKDSVITINGFSKSYAMTGSRLGYIAASKDIATACLKLQSQLNTCPNAIAQHGGCVALTEVTDDELAESYDELKRRGDFVHQKLIAIPHVTNVQPEGAFYAFQTFLHILT